VAQTLLVAIMRYCAVVLRLRMTEAAAGLVRKIGSGFE